MAKSEGFEIKIVLEVTGGFTGPAGKRVVKLVLGELPESKAAELRRELELIPSMAWGRSFFAPHPKPWDFRYLLRVEDGDNTKQTEFHRYQGPAELSRIAEKILECE